MNIDRSYSAKVERMEKWEARNKIVLHIISFIASIVAMFMFVDLRFENGMSLVQLGKPFNFYALLFILGLLGVGSSEIVEAKLEYIKVMGVNTTDYSEFNKAIRTTYFDKLIIFIGYVIAYYVIGYIILIVNMLLILKN